MARKEGLRPIGDSIKKIIEKIQRERRERLKKGKPIRTQPKLPGLKKGGGADASIPTVKEYANALKDKDVATKADFQRARKRLSTEIGRSVARDVMNRQKNVKREKDMDDKVKASVREIEARKMKKGGDVKSPKPGTYEYYLLNRPKHSPAPIKPQKMDKGGKVKKPVKIKKIAIGIGKAKDYPGIKKIIEMNKKGKKRFAEGGMIPKTPKQKKFAALAEPKDKITYADKIAGATGKSKKMKQGGMARGGGAAIRGNNFKGVY